MANQRSSVCLVNFLHDHMVSNRPEFIRDDVRDLGSATEDAVID